MFVVLKSTHDAIVAKLQADRDDTLMLREATIGRLQRENARLLDQSSHNERGFKLADDRDSMALAALTQIAAQATPGANATVKRMARIAQHTIDARFATINSAIADLEEPAAKRAKIGEAG